jgi:aerobic carbon-monoxide dehydrogenase medium subunit
MKPASFNYHSPKNLEEVFAILNSSQNSRVLAGGQSLMPMLNYRLLKVDDLIDLNGVSELRGIKKYSDFIEIGSMTKQFEIAESPIIQANLPLMWDAIHYVGHVQTRNRGTIGGSLCQMDPSAELSLVCSAYQAELVVQNSSGERVIPIDEFSLGYMTTCLNSNDILKSIRLRPWSKNSHCSFLEFSRRHGDFAVVSAACLVEKRENQIEKISIVLGGVGSQPLRLSDLELKLLGLTIDKNQISDLISNISLPDMLTDKLYPSWYREHLSRTLIQRVLYEGLSINKKAS